jgi:hypothetical protein
MRPVLFLLILSTPFTRINSQDFEQFQQVQHKIDSLKDLLNGSSTSVSFGFSGNSSNANQLLKLNSNISFQQGTFPFEFSLNLKTETQLKNGVFDERLSDFLMTYDYYPNVGHPEKRINRKVFVFLNRYSDAYLGVEEKYEIGFGGALNKWGRGFTKEAQRVDALIDNLSDDSVCLGKIFGTQDYKSELEHVKKANSIKGTRVRLAILGGIFYEIEKVVFEDSIPTSAGIAAYPSNFNATGSLKWEIRPTFEIHFSEDLHFSSKCYLKAPFADIFENEVRLEEAIDSRVDFFIDFQNALSYKINKNVEIELEYRLMYDNAPQRAFIVLDNSGKYLLMPDQRHQYYCMNFKVKF